MSVCLCECVCVRVCVYLLGGDAGVERTLLFILSIL